MIVDLWDFENPEYFDNAHIMETIMRDSLMVEQIEPVSITYKKFQPHGLTMLMLLEESHFAIHLYAESSFLAASLYTCGSANTEQIMQHFINRIQPKETYTQTTIRGVR